MRSCASGSRSGATPPWNRTSRKPSSVGCTPTALWLRDAFADLRWEFGTGKTFASTQTHWLRIADDKVIEHWANRDDLGMAVELGWVPPTPLYLLRSALAKRRARCAAA